MSRLAYNSAMLIGAASAVIVLLPVLLVIAASRIWRAIELHAVFGGDVVARDKAHWRAS